MQGIGAKFEENQWENWEFMWKWWHNQGKRDRSKIIIYKNSYNFNNKSNNFSNINIRFHLLNKHKNYSFSFAKLKFMYGFIVFSLVA